MDPKWNKYTPAGRVVATSNKDNVKKNITTTFNEVGIIKQRWAGGWGSRDQLKGTWWRGGEQQVLEGERNRTKDNWCDAPTLYNSSFTIPIMNQALNHVFMHPLDTKVFYISKEIDWIVYFGRFTVHIARAVAQERNASGRANIPLQPRLKTSCRSKKPAGNFHKNKAILHWSNKESLFILSTRGSRHRLQLYKSSLYFFSYRQIPSCKTNDLIHPLYLWPSSSSVTAVLHVFTYSVVVLN